VDSVSDFSTQQLREHQDTVTPLAELERREILKALRVTRGSVGRAAKLLGIGRATLYRRLAEYDQLNDAEGWR
jgi:transcriptional regulator of acetoin/glycerol metabolism